MTRTFWSLRTTYGIVLATSVFLSSSAMAFTIEEVFENYGDITTIAGTGIIGEKGVSGWEGSMEGGPAIDAELSRPHMAMADIDGNVYIADKDAHAVRVIRTDGTIHTVAGTNEPGGGDIFEGMGTEVPLSSPNGLYTLPDGTTYILDTGNALIRKLDTDGNLTTLFEDESGIAIGRGLWVSEDESRAYFASSSELRVWTPEEGVEVYADGFVELGNIAVDPTDGNVVATDREGHVVYKVFGDGEKEIIAGTGETRGGSSGDAATSVALKEVRGVTFNSDGSYYVATHDGGQIWFIDNNADAHLLVDGDDDGTHAGDGTPISEGGKRISEPRAITIAPNMDLIITEHDAGYIRRVEWVGGPAFPLGDYNKNGIFDVQDIDELSISIRSSSEDVKYDLDGNLQIDQADRLVWIEQIANTYVGDSNLDGEFNSSDLVQVFQAATFENQGAASWATGDWDGDGIFSSSDFVFAFQKAGYEVGPRGAVAVPEPNTVAFVVICLGWIALRTRTICAVMQ